MTTSYPSESPLSTQQTAQSAAEFPLRTPSGNMPQSLGVATPVQESDISFPKRAKGKTPYEEKLLQELEGFAKYETASGSFRITFIRRGSRHSVGDIWGSYGNTGYLVGQLNKRLHKIHDLVWLWNTGELPKHEIDHINKVRTDNRIENLRDVTRSVNNRNKETGKVPPLSGYRGVSFHNASSSWEAIISDKGKHIFRGRAKTPEAAAALRAQFISEHPELGFIK